MADVIVPFRFIQCLQGLQKALVRNLLVLFLRWRKRCVSKELLHVLSRHHPNGRASHRHCVALDHPVAVDEIQQAAEDPHVEAKFSALTTAP